MDLKKALSLPLYRNILPMVHLASNSERQTHVGMAVDWGVGWLSHLHPAARRVGQDVLEVVRLQCFRSTIRLCFPVT